MAHLHRCTRQDHHSFAARYFFLPFVGFLIAPRVHIWVDPLLPHLLNVQTSNLATYYYSNLRDEQRELIMTKPENHQGEYPTEELVRRLTENTENKSNHDVIEAPVVREGRKRRIVERRVKRAISKEAGTSCGHCLVLSGQSVNVPHRSRCIAGVLWTSDKGRSQHRCGMRCTETHLEGPYPRI